MNISSRYLSASAAIVSLILLVSCTGRFGTEEGFDLNSPQSESSDVASCSAVGTSSFISQDQQVSFSVSSNKVVKIEFSVNNSNYNESEVTKGVLTWPKGYFEPGSYDLKFRGISETGSYVTCDPASQTVSIYSSPSSAPGIPSGPSGPSIPSTPNGPYVPLTGYTSNGTATDSSFKNYKSIYHPDNLALIDVSAEYAPGLKCYNLQVRHHRSSLKMASSTQKYRVFIPPGTKYFDMITLTFWDQTTKQAMALKMDSPPLSSYDDALNNANLPSDANQLSRVLEMLLSGQEIRSYINEGGNVLPRISGGTTYGGASPYIYQTSRGGWLYINQLKLIGEVAMNFEVRMCVEPGAYRAWYNSAAWDSEGNPL